jgi:hypothetical protein
MRAYSRPLKLCQLRIVLLIDGEPVNWSYVQVCVHFVYSTWIVLFYSIVLDTFTCELLPCLHSGADQRAHLQTSYTTLQSQIGGGAYKMLLSMLNLNLVSQYTPTCLVLFANESYPLVKSLGSTVMSDQRAKQPRISMFISCIFASSASCLRLRLAY